MRIVGLALVGALAIAAAVAMLISRQTPAESVPTPEPSESHAPSDPPAQDPVVVAAEFLISMTPQVLLDESRRRTLIDRWADPAGQASLHETYDAEAARVRRAFGGMPRLSRSGLLGYRTTRRSATRIDVAIWAVAIAAGSRGAGAAGWSTLTVELQRRSDAWRVLGVESVAGPEPSWSARSLSVDGGTFHPFRYAR